MAPTFSLLRPVSQSWPPLPCHMSCPSRDPSLHPQWLVTFFQRFLPSSSQFTTERSRPTVVSSPHRPRSSSELELRLPSTPPSQLKLKARLPRARLSFPLGCQRLVASLRLSMDSSGHTPTSTMSSRSPHLLSPPASRPSCPVQLSLLRSRLASPWESLLSSSTRLMPGLSQIRPLSSRES